MKRRLATAAVCSAATLFAASLQGAVEERQISSAAGADLEIVSVVYYSDDPRFDVERDVKLGELDLGAVAGHATTKERALDVVVPRDAREGYRFVLAVIDDGDQVRETDEHDNVALEAIQVGTSE